VNVVGPGTALPGSGAYSLNAIVAFTVTPDTGAVFLGWTGPDGGDVDANDRLLMSGAREVTATFEIPEPIPEGPPAETPAPEPDPTPEPEVTMSEESVPEGAPDTESTGEEEIVTDLAVPLDTPELPQTSGVPLLLITGTGVASIAGGVVLIRRKRKTKH
jgi:LPXTG-motif cell wall-anchored protein